MSLYVEAVPLVNRWICLASCKKHAAYAIRVMRVIDRAPGREMLSVKEFCNQHAWDEAAKLVEEVERTKQLV